MTELIRRAAPGLALAGVALAGVWLFDPALQLDPAPGEGSAASPPGAGRAAPDGGDPADCSTATTATGDAAMTRWGPVQVTADLAADGSICDVQAIAYPDGDARSAQINARAIPILDAQALARGTQFDAVSGATYTSEAYRSSLQSVLDAR